MTFKTIKKRISYLRTVYSNFQKNELCKKNVTKYFFKYLYINSLLYVFDKEVTFLFLNNIKVKAKKGDGIVGNYHSILQEPNESAFLLHYLTEDDVFLDIGANVGHYTLIASLKTKAKVIAVEPIFKTFKRLKQNVSLNNLENKVEMHNLGMSDKNGELFFTEDLNTTNRVNSVDKGIKVEVKFIDEYFADKGISVIKIDVEGYEWFVLNGAKNILDKESTNVVIIELNNSSLNFNIDEFKVIEFLTTRGFSPYEYDFFNRKLVSLLEKNKKQFNTIFIKNINLAHNRIDKASRVNLGKFSI